MRSQPPTSPEGRATRGGSQMDMLQVRTGFPLLFIYGGYRKEKQKGLRTSVPSLCAMIQTWDGSGVLKAHGNRNRLLAG